MIHNKQVTHLTFPVQRHLMTLTYAQSPTMECFRWTVPYRYAQNKTSRHNRTCNSRNVWLQKIKVWWVWAHRSPTCGQQCIDILLVCTSIYSHQTHAHLKVTTSVMHQPFLVLSATYLKGHQLLECTVELPEQDKKTYSRMSSYLDLSRSIDRFTCRCIDRSLM